MGQTANTSTKLLTKDQIAESVYIIDFSLTVKAATLIFISGCGSAISSAKQGKYILLRIYKLFGPRKRACIS